MCSWEGFALPNPPCWRVVFWEGCALPNPPARGLCSPQSQAHLEHSFIRFPFVGPFPLCVPGSPFQSRCNPLKGCALPHPPPGGLCSPQTPMRGAHNAAMNVGHLREGRPLPGPPPLGEGTGRLPAGRQLTLYPSLHLRRNSYPEDHAARLCLTHELIIAWSIQSQPAPCQDLRFRII